MLNFRLLKVRICQMKPSLLQVEIAPDHSFAVRPHVNPLFYNQWHYHPELELTWVQQGSGIRFVGDSIENFQAGDLILLGPNLPHFWRSDECPGEGGPLPCQALVVQFGQHFWGEAFLALPELAAIRDLLVKARRGIRLTGPTRDQVSGLMQELAGATGLNRILGLLRILQLIAAGERTYLSSVGFNQPLNAADTKRIAIIYAYTLSHFSGKIKLEEAAALVHMTPNAFCRYFKRHTRKTYSQFLTEIRIGHACKLLMEDFGSIAQVCLESGFQNFSNFNRYFKAITQLTPYQYTKLHRKSPA
jgi:AraC-like DNA-binding protein